ncbi:MAG: NAD(P)-dependent oxidoreductase [Byssovorax sp.]
MSRILITGSAGLVGRALRSALAARHDDVVGLDLQANEAERGDVRDSPRVDAAVRGCVGIIHLAAVSRVIWGERDPEGCWSTNVDGLRNLLSAAEQAPRPPWVIFASSREVYGQADAFPVTEAAPLRPVNIYGRSKERGEALLSEARTRGLRAAVIRLSNVYGRTRDHADRVVPAFARAAALGEPLRVEGADHTFDFTHLDDTVRGIVSLVDLLRAGRDAPGPIHLLTGQPTTLGELASLAVALAGSRASITQAAPRTFDVERFHGDPRRAQEVLSWAPRVPLREGLGRLIQEFSVEIGARRAEVLH